MVDLCVTNYMVQICITANSSNNVFIFLFLSRMKGRLVKIDNFFYNYELGFK